MVAFTKFGLAISAISGVFAAPAADPAADAPDFFLGGQSLARRHDHSYNQSIAGRQAYNQTLARRQDYNQNYVTGGSVNFSPSSTGYSVSFSGAGDFVVGKGWSTGTERAITFDGSTTASAGTVLVSVYGWSKSPLIEYYIQEYTNNGAGSAQGTKKGTVVCDGATYDIWEHQQVNQPSISGTTTFNQYISNRQTARPGSGTVTTKCHFDAWAALGMNLGTLNYQVLATEGWGNAGGNSKYTVTG